MNLASIVIASLMALIFSAFVLLLFSTIIFNLKTGEKYRQNLANRLAELRLGNMLSAVGVDIDSYLYNESSSKIQQQMSHCSACENTSQCDEALAESKIDIENIGFCNNADELKKVAAKQLSN